MGLFSRHPAPRHAVEAVAEAVQPPPKSLWADGFGRLAIRAVQIIIVVVLVAGLIWGIRQVSLVIIPLVLALIFASAFGPFTMWMRRKGVPAVLATVLTLLAVVLVLSALGWLVVNAVINQWDTLSTQAVEGFQKAQDWYHTLPFAISPDQVDQAVRAIGDFVTSAQFGSGALAGVSAVASFLTGFVLMVVILFFFLKDGPRMWEFVLRPFRGSDYERGRRIGDKTVTVLGAYIRGTASVAAVDAIGIGIGLAILQVPLALPLAVLVFLLAFIPIVGAVTAGILAALVALVTNGWVVALIVVGIVVLVNQLEGNFLQPVLMGRSMKLHSFVVLVVLAGGTAIGGILGTLLAVPLTAVVWGIITVWNGTDQPAEWARRKKRKNPVPLSATRADDRAVRHPRTDAGEVDPRCPRAREGRGRLQLRAEVGRLPGFGVVGRHRRRDRQPRRQAPHPILPRARRGVRPAAARTLPHRRRGRRGARSGGGPTARLGVAFAAHPPRGIPGEHARRRDPGDVHRLRPARPGERDLQNEPFSERRTQLEDLLGAVPHPVHVTRTTDDPDLARRWLAEFEGAGLDGVIAKPLAQPYAPNKRTMFKIKHARTADVVLLGYRVHKSGEGVGSLLLGLYDDDGRLHASGARPPSPTSAVAS